MDCYDILSLTRAEISDMNIQLVDLLDRDKTIFTVLKVSPNLIVAFNTRSSEIETFQVDDEVNDRFLVLCF